MNIKSVEKASTQKMFTDAMDFMGKWGTPAVIAILLVFFSLHMPSNFPTLKNFETIARSICIVTVISMGKTFAVAVDGIDLSIGIAATFACTAVTICFVWFNLPAPLAITVTILATLIIGAFNAFLIVKVNVPAMLATLATSFIFEGIYLTIAGGGAISETMQLASGRQAIGKLSAGFKLIGQAPWIIIFMFVCVLVVFVYFKYTKFGRFTYIVGSNPTVARLSGISVGFYTTLAYLFSALFGCLGGLLIAARTGGAQVGSGVPYLMPAVAATFIGKSLGGVGKANAIGTLCGAALIGILENGLVMERVPYYALNIAKGGVLALALAINYWQQKNKS